MGSVFIIYGQSYFGYIDKIKHLNLDLDFSAARKKYVTTELIRKLLKSTNIFPLYELV